MTDTFIMPVDSQKLTDLAVEVERLRRLETLVRALQATKADGETPVRERHAAWKEAIAKLEASYPSKERLS